MDLTTMAYPVECWDSGNNVQVISLHRTEATAQARVDKKQSESTNYCHYQVGDPLVVED